MRFFRSGLVALASAALLAACGGVSSGPSINSVVVFGDSLADVGTFGLKFTVQKAGDPKGYPLWTQVVADAAGVSGSAQCNAYVSTGASFAANSNSACTNYAIGGGRIVTGAAQGGSASPLRVGTQMAAASASRFTNALVLIDGGGNDAADLAGAYLGAASGAAGAAVYQTFLGQQLSATALGALSPTTAGFAERAAGAYMVALADTFYSDIRTQVLDRGARNVVVLNMPDVTITPRFRAVLAGVSASVGAAAATQIQGGIRAWITAFNDRLRTLAANDPRVIIIDFNGIFTQQVNSPASFGLTNSIDTACPITGRDGQGLPSYTFPTCTDAALDATPGRTAGWWKTWLFSDSFHPTPYGHQMMGDAVIRAARSAGWF